MTATSTKPEPSKAPVWDLTSYFPEFDGPDYRALRDSLVPAFQQLAADARALGTMTAENAARWVDLFLREEEILQDYSHLSSYIGCLNSGDANNEAYKREQANLSRIGAEFSKAMIPFRAALRVVDDLAFEAIVTDTRVADARYSLERAREDAARSMAPELEELAADLGIDGISSWGRLYNTVAGQLTFRMEFPDGRVEDVPMAQRRALIEDADPVVRRNAMVLSNKAWEGVGEVCAAALNGISGTRLTLNKRRGVNHFLDVAMFQSAVKLETIEQMFDVIRRNREVPRRYLALKARLIGRDKLGFQDLSCPLPFKDARLFDWGQGVEMLLGAFAQSYPRLEAYTREMLAARRIEAEKRNGKRPGAFCTSSYKNRQSSVFMTYGGTLGDIQTLAHELGHAFHNEVMRDLRPFRRSYPMTLAETASTFAEDLLARSIIDDPNTPAEGRALLLNTMLDHAGAFLLDIPMRFEFEKKMYEERSGGELSVSRLRALMRETQAEVFGEVLDPAEMDDMFWAWKLHFYITGVTFYNFPYTFGYLFSQGISARFRAEGPSFLSKYEELLRLTGSASAEEVAQRSLGVDLTKPDFWQQAIDGIREDVAAFEKLAPSVLGVN